MSEKELERVSVIQKIVEGRLKQEEAGRLLGIRELEIGLICMHSPQAKGRVERANKTLQDRWVKEMQITRDFFDRGWQCFFTGV